MARLYQNSTKDEVNTMCKLFVSKVCSILGGFRDAGEVARAENCFYMRLTAEQASIAILNAR